MLCRYRFTMWYVVCVEVVYLLYEWQLPGVAAHGGNALALGVLLAGLTLPAGLAAAWVQWHAAAWLGYAPEDTHAFWPRLIAWQTALLLNTLFVALITRDRRTSQHIDTSMAKERNDA